MRLIDIVKHCGGATEFYKAVEEKLRLLAAENPDFIYNPDAKGYCVYNGPAKNDGVICGPECKGCIFGQAFQLLGWDDDVELQRTLAISELLHETCNGLKAPYVWRTIQVSQDKGQTWAEAVKVLG